MGALKLAVLALVGCGGQLGDPADDDSAERDSFPEVEDSPADTGTPGLEYDARVCPSGGDYPTITAALADRSGDLILELCNQQFFDNVVVADRSLTVRSSAGGDTTWLDGTRSGPVFTVSGDGSTTLTLVGVSLMNGEGSAILATDVAVVVDDAWFYDNQGPGIDAHGAVSVTNTHFHDNRDVAIRAPVATLEDVELRGPGLDVLALVARRVLWVGEGDFNAVLFGGGGADTGATTALSGENLTLVQEGEGAVAGAGTLTNSILVGGYTESALAALDVRYTDSWGGAALEGAGDFSADPLFAELQTYTLSTGSPCVDAGEGLDADGSAMDLGWRGL